MKVAILGGTGKEGAGLGARWALAGHAIIIGSRDEERARAKAAELRERTRKLTIIGDTPLDVDCARACGARAVAVATGFYAYDDLEGCAPDVLFKDLGDVARVLAVLTDPP